MTKSRECSKPFVHRKCRPATEGLDTERLSQPEPRTPGEKAREGLLDLRDYADIFNHKFLRDEFLRVGLRKNSDTRFAFPIFQGLAKREEARLHPKLQDEAGESA